MCISRFRGLFSCFSSPPFWLNIEQSIISMYQKDVTKGMFVKRKVYGRHKFKRKGKQEVCA